MRIARPPDVGQVEARASGKLLRAFRTPEFAEFAAKANREYYHWDELRRRPLPLGLSPLEAWTAIKWTRLSRRPLPVLDVNGVAFTYWLPDTASETLHQVDRSGGGLVGFDVDEPELIEQMKERILIDSHMEEAIATSQIEGAVTTRQRAKDMLRSGRRPRDRSEQMIVNGYRTIGLLRERATQPLTVQALHDIQQSMTDGTLDEPDHAGRFRSPEDAPIHVVDTRDGEVVFTPPPSDQIESRINRLIAFANEPASAQPFMHPLVRAVLLHFWFAYEHPYCDGNGRTARALFYWYMLKSGYWLFEFLTISRIINASRMSYYRSFVHAETDENDLTYFIVHQFDVTRRALNELHERLQEMTAQQQRVSATRRLSGLNLRQRALLDHAMRHPSQLYTFESHQRSHGVTYQTARTDLLALSHRGLLEMLPSKKPMQFVPAGNLRGKLGLTERRSKVKPS